jgi:hypothetical protein
VAQGVDLSSNPSTKKKKKKEKEKEKLSDKDDTKRR